jgi:hypothetical protein
MGAGSRNSLPTLSGRHRLRRRRKHDSVGWLAGYGAPRRPIDKDPRPILTEEAIHRIGFRGGFANPSNGRVEPWVEQRRAVDKRGYAAGAFGGSALFNGLRNARGEISQLRVDTRWSS